MDAIVEGFIHKTREDYAEIVRLDNVNVSLQLLAIAFKNDDNEMAASAAVVVLSSVVTDMKRIADVLEKIAARPGAVGGADDKLPDDRPTSIGW